MNLPTNSSLSVTLSQKSLRTHTTASCSSTYSGPDSLLLNGSPEDIQSSKRTQACLKSLRELRAKLEEQDASLPKLSTLPLKLVSINNFPTAAGLASSAAGFAALVRAIANLYELPQSPTELSLIARQGSGSACRSLMGGYVAWREGTKSDGSDSVAEEVAPASHWPEMRAVILVVSADKKAVASTAGMQVTVETSTLFPARANEIVAKRMTEIEKAIQEKDFESFGRITMQDSNSFHATCLDSWPPITYLNDVSFAAMAAVQNANRKAGKIVAAYTFDAGPNAVIYYLEKDAKAAVGALKWCLGGVQGWEGEYANAIPYNEMGGMDAKVLRTLKAGVSRVICTGVGESPEIIEKHLIDESGRPLSE